MELKLEGIKLLTNSTADNRKSVLWIFATTAVLQGILKSFSWNLSLYFSLRAWFAYLSKTNSQIISVLLHPGGIFASHLIHNSLMVHQADWIDPSYIRLWLSAIPMYKKYDDYINDFSSDQTNANENPTYKESQCSTDRLKSIPTYMLQSLKVQLPMVSLLYSLPLVIKRKVPSTKLALELVVRILRTSVLLTILPYVLTEFPCIYSNLLKQLKKPDEGDANMESNGTYKANRHPLLHVATTSVLSTFVFLAEPRKRLEMMVVYTYYRIIEGVIRKFYLQAAQNHNSIQIPVEAEENASAIVTQTQSGKELQNLNDGSTPTKWKSALASVFTGVTAVMCVL